MDGLPKLPGLVWLGFGASAAMLIGAFGPWGKTVGLVNVSIGGTDGSNDGWGVVVAALVGAGGLVAYMRGTRWGGLAPLIAGLVSTGITYSDRQNVTDLGDTGGSDYVALQVGWGLNLALAASGVLAIVGLVALFEKPPLAAVVPESVLYRPCPNCNRSMGREDSVCPHCKVESAPYVLHEGLWWVLNESGRWQYMDAVEKDWHWYTEGVRGGPSSSPGTDTTTTDSPVEPDEAAATAVDTPRPATASTELERLAGLHARGVLTDEEFQQAKQNVLRG